MSLLYAKKYRDRVVPKQIYEDNYGYTINFYQPMIDYIDAKQEGRKPQYPHLPWSNERGLERYRSDNTIKKYSSENIKKYTDKISEKAKFDLSDDRIIKRSAFSVIKSVSAARVKKHLKDDSVVDRTLDKINNRQSELRESQTMADIQLAKLMKQFEDDRKEVILSPSLRNAIKGKTSNGIRDALLAESRRNIKCGSVDSDIEVLETMRHRRATSEQRFFNVKSRVSTKNIFCKRYDSTIMNSMEEVRKDLTNFSNRASCIFEDTSKQTSIEIEQLNARVVEAETKLKTEIQRIKKKMQIHITELEMSLDVANKTNIDLQKVIKKQSLQLTELQAHYDDVQRQLQQTLDSYSVAQRRLQSLTGEIEEVRGNFESAQRSKRQVEVQLEETITRVNELTAINININSSRAKLEQEITTLASDYEEVSRELRISDERYQKVQVELKHTVEILHEEQERIVKIEAIKKSLEVEVKNLSIRLEEVEANAVVGSRRIISKLEGRIRDLEIEMDEEKRRHAETIKILRKKERSVKEVMVQVEEDQKTILLLQEALDKSTAKLNLFKRQLNEQEGMSAQSVTRVRRFQRELEAAEDRAEAAESNLNLIRTKHRSFVTTSTVPGSLLYLVQETTRTVNE